MTCENCTEQAVIAFRDLHQIGVKEDKTVWAPCGNWHYYCQIHSKEPHYFNMDELCPHGTHNRVFPRLSFPLIGTKAIVLVEEI